MNKFLFLLLFLFLNPLTSAYSSTICTKVFSKGIEEAQGTFLYGHLLKEINLPKKSTISDDLTRSSHQNIYTFFKGRTIQDTSDFTERLSLIKDFRINKITAAPGHRKLRNQAQVKGLIKYIQSSRGGDFSHDKILLNIVTDSNGRIDSLDLWNAHHRLVAYLEAGYKTLDDIPLQNIDILVNGRTTKQEAWSHYLSIGGVDTKSIKEFDIVPSGGEIREGTISVSGNLSNFRLGSRNTLGQLRNNTFDTIEPKIGVYFGTFNPIHEGHISLLMHAKKTHGFDQIIIVPNINPSHKSGVLNIHERNNMIAARVHNLEGINLYTGNSAEVIDSFGRNPFFERMTQTYGSYNLHQLIGDDSFVNLINEGKLESSLFRKYLVFKRKNGPEIPNFDAEKGAISNYIDDGGVSSTQIREFLDDGVQPNPNQLHPNVFDYIRNSGTYR